MNVKKWYACTNDKLKRSKLPVKIIIVAGGFLATLWFLIRVIPKPSRAAYPCMQAASPYMAAFIIWLLSISASAFSFKKAFFKFRNFKYISGAGLALAGVIFTFISLTQNKVPVFANSKSLLVENISIGEAKGIFPGRVVWIWNNDVTNENCTNVFGDAWFMDNNTNLQIADSMARQAILQLTGTTSTKTAWEELFSFYNSGVGKGDVDYMTGEKIFIKINNVSSSASTLNPDYSIKNTSRYGMAESSPQIVLSVLRQLVNDCGIPQDKIYVGDPIKHIYKHVFELWHNEFPEIHYIDHKGTYGREKAVSDNVPVIFYSDRGKVMIVGSDTTKSDALYNQMKEADYLINIGALKGHARAGITLCAKNHFGSHTRSSAAHLHPGLVMPDKVPTRTGYGNYRVQVDLMGHKLLGGKTILYIVDGLWGGSEANDPPRKWTLAPFNNDWTSSLLVSQDPVAIESVGFDFLKAEYTSENPYGSYPQILGVDDYLMQAADSAFWPAGIKYDPEKDGTILKSLGVFEHWNNPLDKQYSQNLKTGNGIELVFIDQKQVNTQIHNFENSNDLSVKVYPNPVSSLLNLEMIGNVINKNFTISSIDGRVLYSANCQTDRLQIDVSFLKSGTYFVNIEGRRNGIKLVKK